MSKRRIILFAKYSISIGLIVFILLRADLKEVVASMKEANFLLFGGALLVMAFNMLVRSYKWQLLLKVHGTNLPLNTIQNINYMSMFFNNFFLGSIGGDAFRVYRTIGHSNSKGSAASAVIVERITGLFMALLIVLVLGVVYVFKSQNLVTVKQLFVLSLLGLISALVFLVVLKFSSKLANLKFLNKFAKLKKLVEEVITSIKVYKNHRRTIVLALGLSLLYHLGNSFKIYCLALAAHAGVSLIPLFFISPLVALLVMIPISINGIGIQEGSYVFFLEQLGVAGPTALLVAVLGRLTLFILSLFGGLLFLMHSSDRKLMWVKEVN